MQQVELLTSQMPSTIPVDSVQEDEEREKASGVRLVLLVLLRCCQTSPQKRPVGFHSLKKVAGLTLGHRVCVHQQLCVLESPRFKKKST